MDTNYIDKGLVIDVAGLNVGGVVKSGWFNDIQFVRDVLMMITNTEDIEVDFQRRDSELVEDVPNMPFNVPMSAVFGQYTTYRNGGPQGYSFRLVAKNIGANPCDIKIRCQLHGMI
jgi:hypothetical protein